MPLAIRTAATTYGVVAFNAINEALAAHGSWTHVEDVANGTQMATVWRSPTIANTPSYHICVHRTGNTATTGTLVRIYVFEGWNPDTKSFIRPAPSVAYSDMAVPAADGSFGGGAEYPLYVGANINPTLFPHAVSTSTSVAFVVSAARRGVCLNWYSTQSSATPTSFGTIWIGGVDSFVTVNDPVSIGIFDRPNTAVASSRWTRYPTVISAQTGNWGATCTRWTLATGSLNGAQDRLYEGRVLGTRVVVGNSAQASQATSHGGWLRAFIPDVLEFNIDAAGPPVVGDNLMVGADTYDVIAVDTLRTNVWAINRAAA